MSDEKKEEKEDEDERLDGTTSRYDVSKTNREGENNRVGALASRVVDVS